MRFFHRWAGAALCLIVLLISTTGTLLVWKAEYLYFTIPAAREPLNRDPVNIARAAQKIQTTYASGEVRFIQLYSENLALHKVFLSEQRSAWHSQSGEQLQLWVGNERWEDWLLDLHHRFLLGNTVGLNIVGVSGLILIPLSLIGFTLWWPWRRFLRLDIRPKDATSKAWKVSHSNLGVWSLLPILLLAFTGVVLVYPAESRRLLVNNFADPEPIIETHFADTTEIDWLPAFNYASVLFPRSTLRWLSPVDNTQAELEQRILKVGLQQAGEWNRSGLTSVGFARTHTSSKLDVRDGLAQAPVKRGVDFTYPLHTGKLGIAYRILLTLFGLMIVGASAFGLGTFIKRKQEA